MKRQIGKFTLAWAIAVGYSVGSFAATLEIENNAPIASAQTVSWESDGVITISGYLGTPNTDAVADVDFYRFFGEQGEVVNIDIDQGVGGLESVDTMLILYGPGPEYQILSANDEASPPDDGGSILDPRIENFPLPATGEFLIGVAGQFSIFTQMGTVITWMPGKGDYVLSISREKPVPNELAINIDIKPGSKIAPINPKSKGKIPVAILSSPSFNAMSVDPGSLTFGRTGMEESLHKCGASGEDVNHDGLLDLVCHFNNQAASFQDGDLEGILMGYLRTGDNAKQQSTARRIQGHGFLKSQPSH